MKILVFSGTADGKDLSKELASLGHDVTVSVVTEYGREAQGDYKGVDVVSGAKPPEEIESMLPGFDVVIDATHPYATHIRESIKAVCEKSGKPRLRLGRPESEIPEDADAVIVGSVAGAADFLAGEEGNILITTGAKELGEYAGLERGRLFPRVLPLASSLEACEAQDIPRKNMIMMQGPFTAELNTAIMRQFGIRYMVTKDSGKEGGFDEKLKAAKDAGAKLVIIERPSDDGISKEEIVETIEKENWKK